MYINKFRKKGNAAIPTDPDNPAIYQFPLRDRQVLHAYMGLVPHERPPGDGIVTIPLYCHNIIKTVVNCNYNFI